MKYNSRNLGDCPYPLPVLTKIIVDFCPNGDLFDYAPEFYATDYETQVDEIIKEKGWNKHPNYNPKDVWINGAF